MNCILKAVFLYWQLEARGIIADLGLQLYEKRGVEDVRMDTAPARTTNLAGSSFTWIGVGAADLYRGNVRMLLLYQRRGGFV